MTPPALAMSKMDSGNGLRETEIDSGHFPKLLEFTPAECERLERRSAQPGPKKKKLSAAGWAKTESSLSCVGDPRLKGPRLKHCRILCARRHCRHVDRQPVRTRTSFLYAGLPFRRAEKTSETRAHATCFFGGTTPGMPLGKNRVLPVMCR